MLMCLTFNWTILFFLLISSLSIKYFATFQWSKNFQKKVFFSKKNFRQYFCVFSAGHKSCGFRQKKIIKHHMWIKRGQIPHHRLHTDLRGVSLSSCIVWFTVGKKIFFSKPKFRFFPRLNSREFGSLPKNGNRILKKKYWRKP